MKLSIIIPAFNEEFRISKTLNSMLSFFSEKKISFEIIVVNDGSTDKTADIVSEFCSKFSLVRLEEYPKNRGKGHAVNTGVKSALGDLILISDSDMSTPIDEFDNLSKFIDEGFDIVIGSRRIDGANIQVRQPFHRRLAGRSFGLLTQLFLVTNIRDTQCGFKLFKREMALNLFGLQTIDGFCFDAEILFLAEKFFNAKIKEVPVYWYNDAVYSKVSIGVDTFRMLRDLILIRLRHKPCR